jgi:LCP family protein required for cell wall assembly
VLSFLVLTGSGYGWAAYQGFVSGVRTVDGIGASGNDLDGKDQNVLLVGDDSRPAGASPQVMAQLSTQQDGGAVNTDTMMLLHIPAGRGQATVVSFPRDSWVDIPGHGKGKLNSAFAYGAADGGGDGGGMRLLIQTLQGLTGLHVDHFVKVSLLGFYQIAEALGPLQVCLNKPAKDSYSGVDLPAGVSTLNAKQALSFVRQRHGLPRGDLDRQVRQQYFLSAELRKAASTGVLLNPSKLTKLLKAVSSAMETDPDLDLLKFAQQFRDVSAGSVRFTGIPITGTPTILDSEGNELSIVAVDFVALPVFIAQVVGVPQAYTDAQPAAPGGVPVRVVNGNGTAGAGGAAARVLTGLGFRVGTPTTGPTTSLTTVTYPSGMEAQAKAVAAQVPGALVAESSSAAQVTLTLGADAVPVGAGQASAGASPAASAAGRSAAPTPSAAAGSSTPPAPSSAAAGPGQSFGATSCIN